MRYQMVADLTCVSSFILAVTVSEVGEQSDFAKNLLETVMFVIAGASVSFEA